jgi:hypothetical protein
VSRRDNCVSLTQSKRDVDVLKKFLAYVGCPDRPLIELKPSPQAARRAWPRSQAFDARIFSKRIKVALKGHGVTPLKSKTLEFSREAASEAAVWLGLLDGDGWVSQNANHGRPVITFFGTKAVMRQCSEFWGQTLKLSTGRPPRVRSHRGGLSAVGLYGANAARAAQMMLASTHVSLARKRRTLEQIVDQEDRRMNSRPAQMTTCEIS